MKLDRQLVLVMIVAALVMLPRAILISQAHSENMDAQYHLRRGYASLTHNKYGATLARTDGPLGQMLLALPMVAKGCDPGKPIVKENWAKDWPKPDAEARDAAQAEHLRGIRRAILYGHSVSPQALLMIISLWKTILFLPCIVVIFVWCREIYGLKSAWMASALVLIDPTFAAHVQTVALDALGVEGIVITCFFYYRYFQQRTRGRLIAAIIATVAAMLTKHTAVILPGVFALMWVFSRYMRRSVDRTSPPFGSAQDRLPSPGGRGGWLLVALTVFLSLWVLTGFDYSAPADAVSSHISFKSDSNLKDVFLSVMERKWPGGVYLGCSVEAFGINAGGQNAYLLGKISPTGWWYYFPVVATYKVPMGIGVVMLLALLSTLLRRNHKDHKVDNHNKEEEKNFSLRSLPLCDLCEVYLLIPAAAWTIFLMTTRLNYGFRHFLPAYVFILMLSARCVSRTPRWMQLIAWAAVIWAAIDVTSVHPDYLSYMNRPIEKPYLAVNDTNIDWGQSMKQVRQWIDAHPTTRPIYVALRSDESHVPEHFYIGARARILTKDSRPPESGLLILSPVWECGIYDPVDRYGFLRDAKPIWMIGHCDSVYDLDLVHRRGAKFAEKRSR